MMVLLLWGEGRWYSYTIGEVRHLQQSDYKDLTKKQALVEEEALEYIYPSSSGDDDGHRKLKSSSGVKNALAVLQDFHEEMASAVRDRWWDFFWACLSKYRDQMM